MRILVTGSDGFIGRRLIPKLKKHTTKLWDINFHNDIFDENIEYQVKKSDVVIHLAALTNVEESKINPKPFYTTNVLGTARIIYLCMKYRKKLIYPSSLHVYNRFASPYADSKYMAEEIVRIARLFIPVVILRFYNVFGENMNNNSGSIINLFLKSDVIEVYGDGSAVRDFIHVEDIARVIKSSLHSRWDGSIVEVGTGRKTSIDKLAKLFSQYRGVPIKYLKSKNQLQWPIANTYYLKKLYGKKLKTNLKRDIKRLCKQVSS